VTLRLVSYNIRVGGRARENAIAAVLARAAPDVAILQEATDPAVVEQVAAAAGMRAWGARRGQSLGFVSRDAPEHVEWHWPRSSRHAFLELVPAATSLRVFGVHLAALHAAWTERRRVREADALLAAIDGARNSPHLLVGDFNSLAPGDKLDLDRLPARLRPFVWLSGGGIRWQVIRHIIDAGYVDVARECERTATPTFPTWDPHLRLDFMFVPRERRIAVRSYRVVSDTPETRIASDHLPILVEVELAAA
jgi:exodeoxyribonuclease III